MSVIGLSEIKRRVAEEHLVEHLSERELTQPEGCGLDLRLGAVYRISDGGAFIEADGPAGQGLRKGVTTELVARYEPETPADFTITPGSYYLVQTVESLNTPADLMPLVHPRSSLFRAGLILSCTKTDPGYRGQLIFGLYNASAFPVRLQLGARFCNIVFHLIQGETVAYRGQHQGGRVAPSTIERQV